MKISNPTVNLALVVSAGLCTSCALTTLRQVQRAPDFRSARVRHVLVIGHFNNPANRKTFEEEVAPIAKARGFDTVLVARLLERKTIRPGEPAVATIQPPTRSNLQDVNAV